MPPSYIYSLCDTHRWHFSFINVLWTNHHVYVKHTQSIKPSSPQPLTGAQFDSQMHSSSPKTGASMTDRDATQQPKQVQNNVLSVSFSPPDFTHLRSPFLPSPHSMRAHIQKKKKDRKKPTRRAVPLCNPDIVFPHPELLTYCSTGRKEQQWRRRI